MKTRLLKLLLGCSGVGVLVLLSASARSDSDKDWLYQDFTNPPQSMQPFVRWWWNGNRVNVEETIRQLHLLQEAGIGGVEINTIGLPGYLESFDSTVDYPELQWLGKEWTEVLSNTVEEAQRLGMTCDIIVGSGWPFGGRFLELNEQSQRIRLVKVRIEGPVFYKKNLNDLWRETYGAELNEWQRKDLVDPAQVAISFVRLLEDTEQLAGFELGSEWIDLLAEDHVLEIQVPPGMHTLFVGFREQGYTHVKQGAPGADGPVVDHYNAVAVRKFLDRMADLLETKSGRGLRDMFRATFVDSLELDHANWTGDFQRVFEERCGYKIDPYIPFVLDHQQIAEIDESGSAFEDTIRRVRYDFCSTLVALFEERFLQPYFDWAEAHEVQARIQGYGRETHPISSSLLAPLPEGETWLWLNEDTRKDIWPHSTNVNKLVSSGAHLSGKRLVSFEAMTNAVPVFMASLEDFKFAMNYSLMDGLNHPILHGYSYSPQGVDFPGWVRFGSYVNEKNAWWPEFPEFSTFASRMGVLLRNSEYMAQVGIISSVGDEWAKYGMLYQPFPEVVDPWYRYELAKALQKVGFGVDHISEQVLEQGSVEDGCFVYGDRAYPVLVLQGLEHISQSALEKVLEFQKSGGKLVVVGELPRKCHGFFNHEARDAGVNQIVEQMESQSMLQLNEPPKPEGRTMNFPRGKPFEDAELLVLAKAILTFSGVDLPVEIQNPDPRVSLVVQRLDDGREVVVLANLSRTDSKSVNLQLGQVGLPWLWDVATGERFPYEMQEDRRLEVALEPLETVVFVMDNRSEKGLAWFQKDMIPEKGEEVVFSEHWTLEFFPADGAEGFTREVQKLTDLSTLEDSKLATFGGRIRYTNRFHWTPDSDSLTDSKIWLDLGTLKGTVKMILNGSEIGTCWYGRPVFEVSDFLKEGENEVELEVSTVLANAVKAHELLLPENQRRWAHWFEPIPMGLEGPIKWIVEN